MMIKDHLCFAYVSNVLLLFTAVIGARLRSNANAGNPLQGWLGGTLRTEQPVGSTTAKQFVSKASDLNCYDLNAQCLWRNEAAQDVSISWVVGSGEPDLRKFRVPMRTHELPGGNDGKFLAALAEQPHTAQQKALLVSSIIQCQKSTGTLKFRHWISPRAKLMVCTRVPGSSTYNQNCVEIFRKSNGVIANVPIGAQPNHPFEIVFEASNFVVRRPRALPGTIILDDITYEAELCSKGATSTSLPPRIEQPSRPHNVQQFANACNSLKCSFENGVGQEHRACPNYIQVNVKVTSGTVGNRHTGIKDSVKNAYGYVTGPGDLTILQSQSFSIPTAARLKFCYNSPAHDSQLVVTAYRPSGKSVIFTTPEFDVSKAKEWKCPTVLLDIGTYNTIEFVAKKLRNEYSLLAIDEITLVDVASGANLC